MAMISWLKEIVNCHK